MALETLRPTSVFVGATWTFNTVGLFQDASDSLDTTWDRTFTLADDILFEYANLVLVAGAVSAVTLNTRWEFIAGSGGSVFMRWRISGSTSSSASYAPGAGVFTTQNDLLSVLPTFALINGSQFGAQLDNYGPGPDPPQLLDQWLDVTILPTAGMLSSIIGQYLGPLVAVGLHEMPRLAREVLRRSRGRISIERRELEQAWRELRAAPHRSSWVVPA